MFVRIQTRILILTTLIAALFFAVLLIHIRQQHEQALALVRVQKQEESVLFQRATELLGKSLRTYAYDYSYWDEMLGFVKAHDKDQDWAYENITTSLATYNAHFVWVYHQDFSLHFSTGIGPDSVPVELPIPRDSLKLLTATTPFPHFFLRTSKGLVEICGAPLQPTRDIERKTSPQGWLFVGALWTRERLDELALLTSSSIRLIPADIVFSDRENDFTALNTLDLLGWNGRTVVTLSSVNDLSGIKKSFQELRYNLLISVLFLTVILAAITFLLFRYVSTPLRRMSFSLETGSTRPLERLMRSKTEFGKLSALIVEFFGQNERLQNEIAQREKSEAALRDGEKRFRNLADLLPLTVFETDEQGMMTFLNGRAIETVGITTEQIERGLTIFDLVHPNERERARQCYEQVMSGTVATGSVEFIAVRVNGTVFDCFAQVSAIVRGGKICGVRGFAMDITDRKRAENALRRTNEMLETLFATAPLPIYTVDLNGCVSDVWNPAAEKMLGWSREEVQGRPLPIVPPDQRDFFLTKVQDVHESHALNGMEVQACLRDGTTNDFAVYATPLRNPENQITGSLAILVDLSERIRSENAVREANNILRTIIDTVPLPICTMDCEGRIGGIWNPAAERMFGWSRAEVMGKFVPAVPEEIRDQYRREIAKICEGKAVNELEVQLVNHDGSPVYGSFYGAPLRDADSNVSGVIAVLVDLNERRRMEQALRESEERFRNLSDTAPVLIWMGGVDRHCYYFNKTWLAFTGRSLQQEYGKGWLASVHPDDVSRCLETYRSAFATRRSFSTEFRLIHADGTYHWMLDRGAPRYTPEGAFTGFIGTCTDITDRRQAEEAMRESEERFRAIFETANDAIFIRDRDLVYTHVNPGSEKFLGFSSGRVIGKTNLELYGETIARQVDEEDRRVLRGETTEEESAQSVRGVKTTFHIIKVPLRNRDGRIVGICGIARDITARKRAEEALLKSEEKFRCIVENINDVVMLTTADGKISYLSPSCRHVLGYEPGDLEGQQPWIIHPDDLERVKQANQRSLQGEADANVEYRILTKQGEVRTVSHSWAPILNNGKLQLIVSVLANITERKQAEKQNLLLAQMLKSARDCISITDFEDNIIFANDAFLLTYGYAETELIGKNISIVRSPRIASDEAQKILPATLEGSFHGELINMRQDGTEFPIELWTTMVKDETGAPVAMAGVARDISERKRAEEEIAAWIRRYELIVASSGQVVYDYDIPSGILEWGGSLQQVLGYEAAHIRETIDQWCDRIHPDDRGEALQLFDKAQLECGTYDVEYRYRHEDGHYLWMHDRGFFIPGPDGLPMQMLGMMHDITERRAAEKALRENEQYLQTIFNFLEIGMMIVDAETHEILDVNPTAERLIGCGREQILNRVCQRFVCPAEKGQCPVADLGQSMDNSERKILNRNGASIPVLKTVVPITLAGRPCHLETFVDITARKKAEEEIAEWNRRFEAVVAASGQVVYEDDMASGLTYWSGSLQSVLGYASSKSVESVDCWRERIHPEDRDELLQRVVIAKQTSNSYDLQYRYRHEDGHYLWIQDRGFMLRDENGEIVQMLGMMRDITERRAAEEAAREKAQTYRLITDHLLDVVWKVDRDLRFTYISPSVTRLFGYSVEEALTFTIKDVLTPASFRNVQTLIGNSPLEGMAPGFHELPPTEFECIRKDGTTFWADVAVVSMLDEEGNGNGLIGITRDITERRLAEGRLRQAAASAQAIVEAAPLPMIVMRLSDKRVVFANAPLRRVLGLPESADVEFPTMSHFDSEEQLAQHVDQIHRDGCLQGMQITMKRPDGTPVSFVGSVRMFDLDGDPAVIAMAVPVPKEEELLSEDSQPDSPAVISHHLEALYTEIKESLDRARQHITVSDSHNQTEL